MKTQSEAQIVAGKGERFTAWKFPNGRYGVKDAERQCQTLASGLDESDAVEAAQIANANGRWHPTLTHATIRANRAAYGFAA